MSGLSFGRDGETQIYTHLPSTCARILHYLLKIRNMNMETRHINASIKNTKPKLAINAPHLNVAGFPRPKFIGYGKGGSNRL